MKEKLLANSGTKEGLEKMINQYFYSTNYKIDDNLQVIGFKGVLSGYRVEFKKNKFRFIEIFE